MGTGMLDIIDLFIEPDPESDYETGANDALIMVRSYVNRRIDRIEREVIK